MLSHSKDLEKVMQSKLLHMWHMPDEITKSACDRTQLEAATINQLHAPSYNLYVQLPWYRLPMFTTQEPEG